MQKCENKSRKESMPRSIGPKFPIIVTSYEVAMNDAKKYLRHYSWKYILVDEGHMLKNPKCKLLRELKLLTVENKLLLTGTPLHNNLVELWLLLRALFFLIYSHLKKNSIHGCHCLSQTTLCMQFKSSCDLQIRTLSMLFWVWRIKLKSRLCKKLQLK
ncbi:hypothetical protein ACET3Z_021733 [Daucus carota]